MFLATLASGLNAIEDHGMQFHNIISHNVIPARIVVANSVNVGVCVCEISTYLCYL